MFGQKLKNLRKQMNTTQEDMAELLKIPMRTYAAYEREENNPPYSMLITLCKEYKLNLNWFIADVGDMFIAPQYEDVKEEILEEVDKLLVKYGVKSK